MVGTGITKLGTVCAGLKSELKGRALIIDMKDVMLISQEGENTLLQLINHGAKFCPDGVLANSFFNNSLIAAKSNSVT
jgi:hypothetical protein